MQTSTDKPRKDSKRDIYERNNKRNIYLVNTRSPNHHHKPSPPIPIEKFAK